MALDGQADTSAEDSVLGSVLLESGRAAEAIAILQAEDFVDPRNRAVFEAISALVDKSIGVDLITVGEELARRKTFESVGGRSRLAELMSRVTSAAHLRHHMQIVLERATLRRVTLAAQSLVDTARGQAPPSGSVQEVLDQHLEQILSASARLTTGGPEFVDHEVGVLRGLLAAGPVAGLEGLRTGFRDLDEITCGFSNGDLVVPGARPSIGKTALLLGIGINVLRRDNSLPILFYSLEMPTRALTERAISSISGVDHYLIRTRQLQGRNQAKVEEALAEFQSLRLAIDDTRGQTIHSIRASARRFKQRHGLRAILVDYLQLVEHRGLENRLQEVSVVSRGLKTLARELDVPVIAAAQLNRSTESQDRPMLSNLRESGTIESDADIVMLMHQVRENVGTGEPRSVEVIVAKNRNGPVGTAELLFQPNFVRFVDLADESPPVLQGPRPLPSEPEQATAFDQEERDYHE